ncbi:hypothetical protein AC578_8953 [Pseudocercospora eumusae]|uniref:Uncharacterized protein n=1 Tax=Pseudocercospora eumusae TaxID=321146 RepID=A0A139HN13_9PEZI|nr:hypothetical protein AC578_8953 [Pseudocercospora eumusae]
MGPASSPPQETQERIEIQSLLALMNPTSPVIAQILHQTAISPPHPLFARSRWVGISHGDYVCLAPSIWVAGRMLTCRKALHFFHAFLFGEMRGDQFKRVYLDHSQPLPAHEKAKVEGVLTQLAELVMIVFTRMEKCHDGMTRPNGSYRQGSPGKKSVIELPKSFLSEIDLARSSPEAVLRRWVVNAVTLAHEYCHSLSFATVGLDSEKRFEHDGFHELGFAFEQFVLEGMVQLEHKDTCQEALYLKTLHVHEINALATNTPVNDKLRHKVLQVIDGPKLLRMFDQSWSHLSHDAGFSKNTMSKIKYFLSKLTLKPTERSNVVEPDQRRLESTIDTLRDIGRFDRPDAFDPDTCTSYYPKPLEAWVSTHEDIILTRAHFINLEDFEHDLLKPAIVLFEKLITSPRALNFWHALLHSRRTQSNVNRQQRILPQSLPLSPQKIAHIHKSLKETSKHFIIILCTPNNIELTGDGVTFTLSSHPSTLVVIAITFSALTLALSTTSFLEIQKHYLRVALTLTHEFAHAFQLIHNPDDIEPFFNDDPFAELGFALLNWLMGGDAGYQIPETAGFVVRRAGTHEVWKKYEKAGTPFAITERLPRREQWVMPDEWVGEFFTRRFWEEDVVETSGLALRVDKMGTQDGESRSLCQK